MIRSLFIAPKDPCDVLASEVELALLRREFPTVAVEAKSFPPGGASTIDVDEWRDPAADLGAFDRLLDLGRAPRAIGIVASSGPIAEAAMQILTRYQGVLDRRNEASQGRLFDKVLERRLELEPDRAAALDVWQWTLRLAPRADLALQLAAVFRDAALAAAGASESRPLAKLRSLLSAAAVPTLTTRRACALLAPLDDRKDEERATLEDAAALSFFSRRSDRTLLTLGVEAMREEARLALHRLRPAARLRLLHIRLLPQVWRIVEETLRSEHGV